MATRNMTMVVNKKHYKEGITPSDMAKYSKVNMYLHHDGYPEWQGVQLANWLKVNSRQDGSALAAKLVFDHYYDSCYLYNNPDEIDHQYTYMIFVGEDTRVVCYDKYSNNEVFDMTPDEILAKYSDDMEYTDFANGETRFKQGTNEDVKYHANKLLTLLQKF